jgi:protein-S-isoprenylcysteine O-methyltransferase Ste14
VIRKAVLESVGFGLVLVLALFAPAGTLAWPTAWAVVAFYIVLSAVGFLILPPDLIAERSGIPQGSQPADLLIASAAFLLMLPGSFAVCGLDARLRASPALPAAVRGVAFGGFALGYAFTLWATRANRFFSSVVRVQAERGHRVVSSGPYAWIRHPGYAGAMAAHLLLPVALGALWGIVPAALGCILLALRIRLEERVLREGLAGYADYCRRVRWRIVPGLW